MDLDEEQIRENISEYRRIVEANNEEIDKLKKKRKRLDEAREKIYNQQIIYSDELAQNYMMDVLITDDRWKGQKREQFVNSINDVMADSICKLETDMENSWVSLEDEIYDIDDRIDDLESENEEKNLNIFIGSAPFLWYNACAGGAEERVAAAR